MDDKTTNESTAESPENGASAVEASTGTSTKPPETVLGNKSQPDGGGPEKSNVPDKYELKVPEGAKLEAGYVDEIASFAKEQGLSQEAAQALLNRDAQLLEGAQTAQEAAIERQRNLWIENLKADKEFGGANFEQTCALAQRAWKRFGPKDVDLGPFGDNDIFVKFAAAVGKVMHEDTLITGGVKVKPQNKDLAHRMYPDMA